MMPVPAITNADSDEYEDVDSEQEDDAFQRQNLDDSQPPRQTDDNDDVVDRAALEYDDYYQYLGDDEDHPTAHRSNNVTVTPASGTPTASSTPAWPQQEPPRPDASAAAAHAVAAPQVIRIDLVEECIEEGKRSAHDRSKVLASTAAYFRTHRGEPVRLQGTGTRHFYIVESGSIDSAACLPATRAGEVCIVSNGLKTILQEKGKAFLLHVTTAKAPGSKTHELHYSISLLDDATGEPVHTERGSDFSRTWKNTMFHALGEYKERPGFILKERKLQEAYMRQVQRALGDAYSTNELKRFLGGLGGGAAAQAFAPPPPPPPPAAAAAAATSASTPAPVAATAAVPTVKKPAPNHEDDVDPQLASMWRQHLPTKVLDHEGAEFESWKKLPGFELALEELLADLNLNSTFMLQLNKGIVLYGTGKFALALEHFRGISLPAKDEDEMHLRDRWIGRGYMKTGKPAKGEETMRKVLAYHETKVEQAKLGASAAAVHVASLAYSLAFSDLAWVFHDQATTADSVNDQRRMSELATASRDCFNCAIKLREYVMQADNSGGYGTDPACQRLLGDDYYGQAVVLLLFAGETEKAKEALEKAMKLASQVDDGLKAASDFMSRIHRGRAVLEIKLARESTGAEARYRHFNNAMDDLKNALRVRIKAMGDQHSQVANLKSLLSEVMLSQLEGLEKMDDDTVFQLRLGNVDAMRADMRAEQQKFRNQAMETYDRNDVHEDHPWRAKARELDAKYISHLVAENTHKIAKFTVDI